MTDEELLLESALKVMTAKLDQFIGSCIDAQGLPKAPQYRDLMAARGYLPPTYKNALQARQGVRDKGKEE